MIMNVYGFDVTINDTTMNQLTELGCPVDEKILEMYLRQDGVTPDVTNKEHIREKVIDLVNKEFAIAKNIKEV